MTTPNQTLTIDALIIGGGIAGLWTLAKLRQAGYHAFLVEKDALGSGQTICSQGIIHGGTKYALLGKITNAQRQIAQMPSYWRACLAGEGEFDLREVACLTSHQTLWAQSHLSGRITGFFASQFMQSHVKKLSPADLPMSLQSQAFQGTCYALDEPVVSVHSLLRYFAKHYAPYILTDADWQIIPQNHNLTTVSVQTGSKTIHFATPQLIYTAGKANESLSVAAKQPIKQQCRPLRMVYARVPKTFGDLYLHVLAASDKPRLTITTHPCDDQTNIWYIGGNVAEKGCEWSHATTIAFAKKELTELFHWLDFANCEFSSFLVERAEGSIKGHRPDTPTLTQTTIPNTTVQTIYAWPTKLAMAPMLADKILDELSKTIPQPSKQTNTAIELLDCSETHIRIADYPWHNL